MYLPFYIHETSLRADQNTLQKVEIILTNAFLLQEKLDAQNKI